jgi:hypothetical protein
MPRGTRTRLFHAIVGLGFAACGGMTAAASKDAGSDATTKDAAGDDASDANALSYDAPLIGPDASSFDASDAAEAEADAPQYIVPIQ